MPLASRIEPLLQTAIIWRAELGAARHRAWGDMVRAAISRRSRWQPCGRDAERCEDRTIELMPMHRPEPIVVTQSSRAQSAAVALCMLVAFGVLGFDSAPRTRVVNERVPVASFAGQRDAVVAPPASSSTENAISGSHRPPLLAFLLMAACLLAIAIRWLKVFRDRSSRRRLEHFFVQRRGPPLPLAAR